MHDKPNGSNTSVTQLPAMPVGGITCVALGLFLFSCAPTRPFQPVTSLTADAAPPPRYSITYVIHGDGNYLYHDTGGSKHRADEEALTRAASVATRNPHAEVLIFHQRPKRRLLWLFSPFRDGTFYYYRHGQLLDKVSYRRNRGQTRFDPEVELYNQYHLEGQPQQVRLFLYFGHEIPELDGSGYDASYKTWSFTIDDLAGGLSSLARHSTRFDLVVLSTCFNGTPHTVGALAPYTRYIIASPGNLHLSYYDLRPLEQLDVGLRDGDVSTFATQLARHAFDRLTQDVQTEITAAVYDVDRVEGYLDTVDDVYESALARLGGEARPPPERFDCAEDPAYVSNGMADGVTVFFRASRFGREKNKATHSGWECTR